MAHTTAPMTPAPTSPIAAMRRPAAPAATSRAKPRTTSTE